MSRVVEAPEVAGHQPAVNDSLRREFRLIQVARHDGFASNSDFANTVSGGIHDAHFHPGQRLADGVRTKWSQIVDRDCRACFRQPVSVSNRNSEIVEKLQRLRFAESAANNNRAKLPAKRFVDLLEQTPADPETRSAFRQRLVDADEELENSAFSRRQRIETRLQPFLQVFQNQRNETHISDLVFRKSFAHVFGTQSSQMHDRRTAREWSEKTNHEIDGMIRRQNTEVTHARPK